MSPVNNLISLKEASAILKISVPTLRKWANDPQCEFPALTKMSQRKHFIDAHLLERWLHSFVNKNGGSKK